MSSELAVDLQSVMGEALIARGVMTAEAVAVDLATTQGIAPPAPGAPPADQAEQPAEAVEPPHDAFLPPADPAGYRFAAPPPGVAPIALDEELSVRQNLHVAGVPNALAASVMQQVYKAASNPPSDADLIQATAKGREQVAHKYGADAPKVLAAAKAELARIAGADPHIQRVVDASGLGSSLWMVSTLYNLARNGGRAK